MSNTMVIDFGNDEYTVDVKFKKDGNEWHVYTDDKYPEGIAAFDKYLYVAIGKFKEEFRNT